MNGWISRSAIRLLDILLAAAGLVVLAAPIIACGLMVRADSPGPSLFRQTRVGHQERPFTCIKLRTMTLGAPVAGTHEISASMVTPLGRTLRRLKLDELPQLWNVLKGEMSLVGPRPCLPVQTTLIAARRRHGVFSARPGITGPGQVAGVDMSEPERLAALDEEWTRGPDLARYFRFIVLTVAGHGRGDRVLG